MNDRKHCDIEKSHPIAYECNDRQVIVDVSNEETNTVFNLDIAAHGHCMN